MRAETTHHAVDVGTPRSGQLLEAARSCFLRDGLRISTMEAVAKASGTSRQTVYEFFPNRLGLIEAAVAERISELTSIILRPDPDLEHQRVLIETFLV